MRFDRIIWGVLLLFIGGVLLLENFNVINFHWSYIWDFWPLILIILGINFLFKKNTQTGNVISLGVLIVALSFLFVKGQQSPNRIHWGQNEEIDLDEEDSDTLSDTRVNFSEPFLAVDSNKKTILNLTAGGVSFNLGQSTTDLFAAAIANKKQQFTLTKTTADSTNTISFKMREKHGNWSSDSDVNLKLNVIPVWEMNLKLGAGEVNFDLANYKIRTLNFNGGAAALEIKLGNLLPITDVNVKTGMAEVKIIIPTSSGCRIKTKTGLSNKDFDGFTKISEGLYQTPNYNTSAHKIFINFDGGLSSFEVDRY